MKRELIGKLQAKSAVVRYRDPARGLRVIVVAGAYGKTTTVRLLAELLQEAGQSVLALTSQGSWHNGQSIDYQYDSSAEAAQRCFAYGRSKEVNTIIIELTDAFIDTFVLPTLTIEMSIITSDSPSTQALLDQSVNYMVLPSGFTLDDTKVAAHQAISYGEDDEAEAKISDVHLYRKGTEVELVIDHQTDLKLATYLVGKANAYNLAAAVAACYVLALDIKTLEEGAARLESITGNYEYISTNRPYSIAVDVAKTARSIERVLESTAQIKKRRVLVALDSSFDAAEQSIAKRLSDRVVMVGEGEEEAGVTLVKTLEEAADIVLRGAKKDDTVLLLGKHFAALQDDGRTRAQQIVEAASE